MKYLKVLLLTLHILFFTNLLHAQCCGDGICDPGENATNCKYDCDPPVKWNCPNTMGSYNNSSTWPMGYSQANDSGYCYTIPVNATMPSTVCFEYQLPSFSNGVAMSFVINDNCSAGPTTINISTGPGGCSSTSSSHPAITNIFTMDSACNVINPSSLQVGHCGFSPGEIITVCVDLNTSSSCSELYICPVVDCGSEDCSTPTPLPTCPPFNLTTSSTDETCFNGGNNGVAIVTPDCGSHFSYLWDDPSTQTDSMATNLAAGTYNVTVTNDSFACDTTVPLTINPPILPTAVIGTVNDTIDCNTTTLLLDGTGSTQGTKITYQWNAYSGGNIVSGGNTDQATIDAGGTYTLVVTDTSTGCVDSVSVNVTEDTTLPVVSVQLPQQLNCNLASQVLDGSGSSQGANFGYQWNTYNGGNITSGGSTDQATINTPGTYTLVVTNSSNGCIDSASVTVTQDTAKPIVIIQNPKVLNCNTTSQVLDGSGSSQGANFGYQWNTYNGGNITGGGSTDQATINTPGTYTLVVTNSSNGCIDSASVTVTQDTAKPSVNIQTPLVLTCDSPTQVLDGTGSSQGAGFSYQWNTYNGGNITSGQTTDQAIIDEPGNYTLVITNTSNGCIDSASVTVSQDTTKPSANIQVPKILDCQLTSQVLNGSGSSQGAEFKYQWNAWNGGNITGGQTTDQATVNTPGTYTLVVTDTSNGCMDSATVIVSQDSIVPVISIQTPDTLDCQTDSVVIDGSSSSQGTNITYTWTTNTGNIISTNDSVSVIVNSNGYYYLTIQDTSNGCIINDSVMVSLDTLSPIAEAGATKTIDCYNPIVTLDGSGSTPGSNMQYQWTGPGITGGNGTTSPTSNQAGVYFIQVTDQTNGCSAIDSVMVQIDTTKPSVTLPGNLTFPCNTQNENITAQAGNGGNIQYSWYANSGSINSGSDSSTANIGVPGSYTVVVTADNGCTDSTTVVINTTNGPVASFTANPNSGSAPLQVDFTNNSQGNNLSSNWDFGTGDTNTATNPSYIYNDNGSFTVVLTVTDSMGCTDTASAFIVVDKSPILIPSGFSPNGDGVNDFFVIKNIGQYQENSLSIFNRWGDLIYSSSPYQNEWEGQCNNNAMRFGGEQVVEGTYYYLLKLPKTDQVYKGYVVLKKK